MTVICLGDSLTEGDYGVYGKRGIANIHKENYPYFLQKNTGWQVVNAGKCGRKASTYLPFLKELELPFQQADAIVILLGTNGGNRADQDTPDNKAYREIISHCRMQAPQAEIYLCTPPHATKNPEMSNFGYAQQVEEAVAFVRQTAAEEYCFLIDLALCPDFSDEKETIMQPNDGLHFSALGYQKLAQWVEKGIRFRFSGQPFHSWGLGESEKILVETLSPGENV